MKECEHVMGAWKEERMHCCCYPLTKSGWRTLRIRECTRCGFMEVARRNADAANRKAESDTTTRRTENRESCSGEGSGHGKA
jgi:hypothetical protein